VLLARLAITPRAHLGGGVEERLAVLLDVVAGLHRARGRQDARQQLLARDQRDPAQVVALEREAVEEHGAHRHRAIAAATSAGRESSMRFCSLAEARAPRRVVRDDLAVEHEALDLERAQPFRDLGVAGGDVSPLRPSIFTSSPRRSADTRTPSYLISNSQPARENGFSSSVASMCFTWDARSDPSGAFSSASRARTPASHAGTSRISSTVSPVITERGQRAIASCRRRRRRPS
jgi:hypothetical protein